MKRAPVIAACVVVGLLLAIQLLPARRDNPPVTADLEAPPEVRAVLRAACYDCHSHETRWPWYSRVAPVSWQVAHDVAEGREHLNFSLWGTLEPRRQERLREEIWEEVEKGEMPIPVYRWAHPEARLDQARLATLRAWAGAADRRRDH